MGGMQCPTCCREWRADTLSHSLLAPCPYRSETRGYLKDAMCSISGMSPRVSGLRAQGCVPRVGGKGGQQVVKLSPKQVARRSSVIVRADGKQKGAAPGVANTVQKAAWYGVEAFGKVAGRGNDNGDEATPSASEGVVMERSDVLAEIRRDYEENKYFVSGQGDMSSYAPDCEFSDPFVSFRGVDRFRANVSNLGAYLDDVELDILDWKETSDDVDVRWRFSCIIDLPWKPKLAAAGGTTHVFDKETGKVVKHIERWDIEVDKVLKQLLVPANKLPTNRWEVFMMSLSAGDVQGLWLAVSGNFIAPIAAVLVGNGAVSLITGRDGLPALPVALGSAVLLLALFAEVQKLTGVGTSNGGKGGGDAL